MHQLPKLFWSSSPLTNQPVTLAMLTQGISHPIGNRLKYRNTSRQRPPSQLNLYSGNGNVWECRLCLHQIPFELFRSSANSDLNTESTLTGKLIKMWKTRLSCVLQKANARLLISKLSRTQQAMQQGSPPTLIDFSTSASWTL